MIDFFIEKLYELFPLHPVPNPQDISFHFDMEAENECSIFREKAWDQINIEEFNIYWRAFFWLNNEYFHYYFPGIMLRSLQEIKYYNSLSKMELAVDIATGYIDAGDDEKWKLFTYNQMLYVKSWYSFILNHENDSKKEEHMHNMDNLFQQLYP